MAQFRNDTKGARVVRLTDRSRILIEPGETSEPIADAAIAGYHPTLTVIGERQKAVAPDKRALLEGLDDEALSDVYEKAEGKKPHHKMKRETIIERLLATAG